MTDVQDAGNYSLVQHQYNVVALGDGEKPDDGDTVRPTLACPDCKENRVVQLFILEDDIVECQTCGKVYEFNDSTFVFKGELEFVEIKDEHVEAAAKHAAIMATITKIVTETAPRGNVQKRRVWGLLDDMIL